LFCFAVAGLTTLFSSAAMADVFSGTFSATVAATSDYRFHGISENDLKPALQGSLDWNGPVGLYAGSWASMVDFNDDAGTSVEWDLYAGKHFNLGDGFDLNVEPFYYAYPNHNAKKAGVRDSYFELVNTLTKTMGRLTLDGVVAWSPDYFGETGTGWWVAGGASYALNDWLSLSGNAGHQWVHDLDPFHSTIGFPYTEWDLGATATWHHFALDARYFDTSISKTKCAALYGPGNGGWCTATAVVTLSYSISP
jgi:uncharacterized protein (TIGR02001 family)